MTISQADRARAFRSLHERPGAFVIANVWDAGSARIMAGLGFEALATSSGASANTLGRLDGKVTLDEAVSQIRSIAGATDLPLSGDLEKGFGDSPEAAAKTIRLAAEAGLVGGSIEDATGDRAKPIFDFELAVDRVAAAVAAARSLPFPFTLTGRCENFLHGIADLDDTIRRLQAYEKAGADVLFAPLLPDLATVKAVCSAVSKPVNFMVGVPGKSFSKAQLEAVGVKRISLATSLYRAAMSGLIHAANEIRESGTFGYVEGLQDINRFMKR
ncbi:2-methylisocitrate lyase-like PEP mutase family enzyme [Povalibacter uvarum]|uniref:2-methylisocitrate lyase-like PEP mutase family enzyme n=1 Tax=Povalibacter uvarum TaxID=732238 RepID=A0A841HRD2_9GAMM|nr:isocitrate lyase/phosphoenolpyruvate mutase family protein [Povalibacter uvarum]MBB6095456.1 2-methylisocitrate lyase-like PEP mutase family enzyme [Povalibacter uvarum]